MTSTQRTFLDALAPEHFGQVLVEVAESDKRVKMTLSRAPQLTLSNYSL